MEGGTGSWRIPLEDAVRDVWSGAAGELVEEMGRDSLLSAWF